MKERLIKFAEDKRIWVTVYVILALVASIQSLSGTKTFEPDGLVYNRYNNYTIFEKSFEHLKNHTDLYIAYPSEHWDLYKYTPTFAAFFGVFYLLPDWLGLILWNLCNAIILLLSIYYLPKLRSYKKGLILMIILVELLTSLQNSQSNALIAGLLLFSFGFLERNKSFWAVLCIAFAMFIKPFAVVGFALFLFYPQKIKSVLYSVFWMAILLLLPLLFVDIEQYIRLYNSYFNLLANDHDASYGYSVMGWLHSWFSTGINKNIIVATGIIMFLIPLYRIKYFNEYWFKYLMLCSVLLWIVIFNHKAESPTFIIAFTGIALWFVQSKKDTLNIILFIAAFIFTSLSPTDLFPHYLNESFVKPYNLKVFPCIIIWIKILYDLVSIKHQDTTNQITD